MASSISLPHSTNISRLIYLSSKPQSGGNRDSYSVPLRPIATLSPGYRAWKIPPLSSNPQAKHQLMLVNLEIYHVWPSVPQPLQWIHSAGGVGTGGTDGTTTLTIPAGDWDALSFANFFNIYTANDQLVFDNARLVYLFDPPLEVLEGSTCNRLLGLPDDATGVFTESVQPVNFSGPTRINIFTNLSFYTAPISSLFASIPIDKNYGECISYIDNSAIPITVLDNQLHILTLQFVDEKGAELPTYDDIPWTMTIQVITNE